ncbi:Reverse transcriptase-RNase H-integrase [Mycena sanguinolenta]|uniref:Reverse transcriptase-RNase H-integrase n=1 Tax=Mycena sanguinolenta TaxID=230812 RepID=A0A8H6Z572_9AGAR|nr:Reverse transcriptase-RNase H-integrase [Mycena sanguinolenta]
MTYMSDGAAHHWVEHQCNKAIFPFVTWDAFVQEFCLRFVGENEQDHALQRHESGDYYMGIRDVFAYTDDFEDLAALAGYTNLLVNVTKYCAGLFPAINQAITASSSPSDIWDYQGWCEHAYHQYNAFEQAKAARGLPHPPACHPIPPVVHPHAGALLPVHPAAAPVPPPAPAAAAAPCLPPPVPMDVDRTRARFGSGPCCCYRCGELGHLANACTAPADVHVTGVLDKVIHQLGGDLLEELVAHVTTSGSVLESDMLEALEGFVSCKNSPDAINMNGIVKDTPSEPASPQTLPALGTSHLGVQKLPEADSTVWHFGLDPLLEACVPSWPPQPGLAPRVKNAPPAVFPAPEVHTGNSYAIRPSEDSLGTTPYGLGQLPEVCLPSWLPWPSSVWKPGWERRLPKHYIAAVSLNGLLDCGATFEFIDSGYVLESGIPVQWLSQPIPIFNVDGSPNEAGAITEVANVVPQYNGHLERVQFTVTRLGKEKLILGISWLQKHNPEVNWETRKKELDAFIEEGLATGHICPSKSLMASLIFFVKKKDGGLQFIQDYPALNVMPVKNRYPLPLINDVINWLKGAQFFTKLDVWWGFNNVWIREGNEWKAAFRTNQGLFKPLVMYFSLTNSPATFQTTMNDIFQDLILSVDVMVYLDDILIAHSNLAAYQKVVAEVLQCLRQHKLYLWPKKCEFDQMSIKYLGGIISHNCVEMDPVKVAGIATWPSPENKQDVLQFLSFTNFFWRFIGEFSDITCPLFDLTKKGAVWVRGPLEERAFQGLKDVLTSDPVLLLLDLTKPYRVEADSSDQETRTVLSQEGLDRKWHPVAFCCKSLSEVQQNYEICDKEMLSIHAVEIWTDHKNYFWKAQNLNRRQARWSLYLSWFDFVLYHKPGSLISCPDPLLRHPDHGAMLDNKDVILLHPELSQIQAMEGVTVAGPEVPILQDIQEALTGSPDLEEPIAAAA